MTGKRRRLWPWVLPLLFLSPFLPLAWTSGRLAFYELGLIYGPEPLEGLLADGLAAERGAAFPVYARLCVSGDLRAETIERIDEAIVYAEGLDHIAPSLRSPDATMRAMAVRCLAEFAQEHRLGNNFSLLVKNSPADRRRIQGWVEPLARADPDLEVQLLALAVLAESDLMFITASNSDGLESLWVSLWEAQFSKGPRVAAERSPAFLEGLITIFERREDPDRLRALKLLETFPKQTLERVLAGLESQEPEKRRRAARCVEALVREGWERELEGDVEQAFAPLLAFCREARGDPARPIALRALNRLVQVDPAPVIAALQREAAAGDAAALTELETLAKDELSLGGEAAREALKSLAEEE